MKEGLLLIVLSVEDLMFMILDSALKSLWTCSNKASYACLILLDFGLSYCENPIPDQLLTVAQIDNNSILVRTCHHQVDRNGFSLRPLTISSSPSSLFHRLTQNILFSIMV